MAKPNTIDIKVRPKLVDSVPNVPSVELIVDYLKAQHCTLWGRSFDVNSNPEEAAEWLQAQIVGIRKHFLESRKTEGWSSETIAD